MEIAMMKECMVSEKVIQFFMETQRYFILLPKDLTVTDLRYPCMSKLFLNKNQNVHFLCSGLRKHISFKMLLIRPRPIVISLSIHLSVCQHLTRSFKSFQPRDFLLNAHVYDKKRKTSVDFGVKTPEVKVKVTYFVHSKLLRYYNNWKMIST